jgi:hypothetical protein
MSIVSESVIDILARGDQNWLNNVPSLSDLLLNIGRQKESPSETHHPNDDGIACRDLLCKGPHDGQKSRSIAKNKRIPLLN